MCAVLRCIVNILYIVSLCCITGSWVSGQANHKNDTTLCGGVDGRLMDACVYHTYLRVHQVNCEVCMRVCICFARLELGNNQVTQSTRVYCLVWL